MQLCKCLGELRQPAGQIVPFTDPEVSQQEYCVFCNGSHLRVQPVCSSLLSEFIFTTNGVETTRVYCIEKISVSKVFPNYDTWMRECMCTVLLCRHMHAQALMHD